MLTISEMPSIVSRASTNAIAICIVGAVISGGVGPLSKASAFQR